VVGIVKVWIEIGAFGPVQRAARQHLKENEGSLNCGVRGFVLKDVC
jgi:hypothetical protein